MQPSRIRQPLQYKEIVWPGKRKDYDKICFYDPTELYERVGNRIDPFKRTQSIGMETMFLNEPGLCACGCKQPLKGRRTRWATTRCSDNMNIIFMIIYGRTDTIYFYLKYYYGEFCACCNRTPNQISEEDFKDLPSWHHHNMNRALKVDHIIPVKHGGGGGWLSNYQLLCHRCHVNKTNEDFGWKK